LLTLLRASGSSGQLAWSTLLWRGSTDTITSLRALSTSTSSFSHSPFGFSPAGRMVLSSRGLRGSEMSKDLIPQSPLASITSWPPTRSKLALMIVPVPGTRVT
jgi:hypothetical protein